MKGGGKEGQGPRLKDKKSKGAELEEGGKDRSKDSANIVGDEEGVWMAVANDSGDEEMANNEFEDFTISNDDLFFFQDDMDSEEEDIINLSARLKKLLNIPSYDIPFDPFDIQDPTESSDDDEKGATAMQVSSESDNEVEINPYWSKIKVDILQGLGAPVETSSFDTDSDSMPDLVTMSRSDDSLIIFILTPPDSCCSEYSVKDNFDEGLDSFSDEEMNELVVDEGEDGCTTVDAAMLVNVGGSAEGVQTELYDSGASWHMSPYQEHFENYVSIVPKSITAADKRYFQAIGKGDLHVKLPNSHMTTTILLKDVLHCPRHGPHTRLH